MAVHNKMALGLTLPMLGLVLGKKFAAYKVTGSLLALSLGTAALAVVAGSLLFMQMTDFEPQDFKNSDKKKQKAG
jgi:hypothetical protein